MTIAVQQMGWENAADYAHQLGTAELRLLVQLFEQVQDLLRAPKAHLYASFFWQCWLLWVCNGVGCCKKEQQAT